MKSLKTAAVVAGAMVIAGAAAPAFAVSAEGVSHSLGGITDTLAQAPAGDSPLQAQTEKLGLTQNSPVGKTLQNPTNGLNGAGSLLGGLPVNR